MKWQIVALAVFGCACSDPPIIESIRPQQGPQGIDVEVEIAGRGFTTPLLGSLYDVAFDYPLRIGSIEDGIDGLQLVTAVVPADVPAGLYDVALRNENGSEARLALSYQVQSGQLHAYVLDVGQGSSLLVIGTDGSTLLVDGGKSGRGVSVVAPALARYAQGRLDAVVTTHFDADHMSGVTEVLSGADTIIGSADDLHPTLGTWDQGLVETCTTSECDRYRRVTAGQAHSIEIGRTFSLGEAVATCVAVRGTLADGSQVPIDDDNEGSIAMLIEFGGRRLLVAGDLTGGGLGSVDVETPLAGILGHVDVWVLNHHGSTTSTNTQALALHTPDAALISVGTDNAYCHPAAEVLQRLDSAEVETFLTGRGMTQSSANCPQVTSLPRRARIVGEIEIIIEANGALQVAGVAL